MAIRLFSARRSVKLDERNYYGKSTYIRLIYKKLDEEKSRVKMYLPRKLQ